MIQVRQPRNSEARAKARAEEATARLLELGLRPTDTIRFPRSVGVSAKVEGRPLDVSGDGSVSCAAGGKLRAIRPEVIEVKMTGPRGGTQWVSLVPEKEEGCPRS